MIPVAVRPVVVREAEEDAGQKFSFDLWQRCEAQGRPPRLHHFSSSIFFEPNVCGEAVTEGAQPHRAGRGAMPPESSTAPCRPQLALNHRSSPVGRPLFWRCKASTLIFA
jgi:hypothetical protein